MTASTHNNPLRTLGKILGLPLVWVLRKEQKLVDSLVKKGFSITFAKRLLTIGNLFIIVSILFALFPAWIAVASIMLAVVAFAGVDINVNPPKEPEWRQGMGGFGLYDEHDVRVDTGDNED